MSKEAMKLALALEALGEILESFEKDGKFCKSSLIRNELFDRIKATFDKCKTVVEAEKQEQGEPVAFDEWCKELAQALGQSICVIDDEVRLRKTTPLESLYWKRPAQQRKPLPLVEGDLLPQVGSKVLIFLARQEEWVEHTVVGYYVWGDLDGREHRMHRVFVRVVDADGILNARMLRDVRH